MEVNYLQIPERISKKWLALELGYYFLRSKGELIIDYKGMSRNVYTDEFIREVVKMSPEAFKKIKIFDRLQSRRIAKYFFDTEL
jgi:hypothetical protein